MRLLVLFRSCARLAACLGVLLAFQVALVLPLHSAHESHSPTKDEIRKENTISLAHLNEPDAPLADEGMCEICLLVHAFNSISVAESPLFSLPKYPFALFSALSAPWALRPHSLASARAPPGLA